MNMMTPETLPCWRDDEEYVQASVVEAAANARQAALYQEYDRAWQQAKVADSDTARLPPPGHPCWSLQYQFQEAHREWQRVLAEKARAEDAAQRRTQATGEAAGRVLWEEFEEDLLPRLIAWTEQYDALRMTVFERTSARLPDLSYPVSLDPVSLTSFGENCRRSFGCE